VNGVTVVCPECGFDPSGVDVAEFGAGFERYGALVAQALDTSAAVNADRLSRRSTPTEWSMLEYTGHIVGVCETMTDWARRSQLEELAVAGTVDQDAEVIEGHYNEVDPATMAQRLLASSTETAATLNSLPDRGFDTVLSFNGMELPLRLLCVAMLHECHHHLHDIQRLVADPTT
jgi:DinB superfamily